MVRIPGFHPGGPGSIPGVGSEYTFFFVFGHFDAFAPWYMFYLIYIKDFPTELKRSDLGLSGESGYVKSQIFVRNLISYVRTFEKSAKFNTG